MVFMILCMKSKLPQSKLFKKQIDDLLLKFEGNNKLSVKEFIKKNITRQNGGYQITNNMKYNTIFINVW